jgi:minor histocompatibility antigen H13
VDEENQEKMTNKDAAMFPVYLSGYLFGLYMLFKIIDPVLVSLALSMFFSMMGVRFAYIHFSS